MTDPTEQLLNFAEAESRRRREWIMAMVNSDQLDERGWPEFMQK
ncbi:MAG TPA: hypothetical protein VGK58_20135 [Lacipirellulaceae bacterium]